MLSIFLLVGCKTSVGLPMPCTWTVEERSWTETAFGSESSIEEVIRHLPPLSAELVWPFADDAPPAGLLERLTLVHSERQDLFPQRWQASGAGCISHDLVPVDWSVTSDQKALQALVEADDEHKPATIALLETGAYGFSVRATGAELSLDSSLLELDSGALDWYFEFGGGDQEGGAIYLGSEGIRDGEYPYQKTQLSGFWLPWEGE